MAIAISLDLSISEQREILCKYGYCLSESIAADMTAAWFIKTHADIGGSELLCEINEVLEKMGVPLLMTRLTNR